MPGDKMSTEAVRLTETLSTVTAETWGATLTYMERRILKAIVNDEVINNCSPDRSDWVSLNRRIAQLEQKAEEITVDGKFRCSTVVDGSRCDSIASNFNDLETPGRWVCREHLPDVLRIRAATIRDGDIQWDHIPDGAVFSYQSDRPVRVVPDPAMVKTAATSSGYTPIGTLAPPKPWAVMTWTPEPRRFPWRTLRRYSVEWTTNPDVMEGVLLGGFAAFLLILAHVIPIV